MLIMQRRGQDVIRTDEGPDDEEASSRDGLPASINSDASPSGSRAGFEGAIRFLANDFAWSNSMEGRTYWNNVVGRLRVNFDLSRQREAERTARLAAEPPPPPRPTPGRPEVTLARRPAPRTRNTEVTIPQDTVTFYGEPTPAQLPPGTRPIFNWNTEAVNIGNGETARRAIEAMLLIHPEPTDTDQG